MESTMASVDSPRLTAVTAYVYAPSPKNADWPKQRMPP
jgi:hypothetical protein